MIPKSLSTFAVLVSVLALAVLPICNARPRSHRHHRNDRLPRIARAAPAGYDGNLVEGDSDSVCGELHCIQRMNIATNQVQISITFWPTRLLVFLLKKGRVSRFHRQTLLV